MKTATLTAYAKYKRTREIDDKDKFFIIKLVCNSGIEFKVGWIEKEFIESDFANSKYVKGLKFDIVDVIEFTDYEKYKEYKTTSEYLN